MKCHYMLIVIGSSRAHYYIWYMSILKRFLLNRLITQMAKTISAHFFTIKLIVIQFIGVSHLQHVLKVAIEMHIHFHPIYVLHSQIISICRRVDNSCTNLLPYKTLSCPNLSLLISSVDTIRVYLRVAAFESCVFLCYSIIVSQGLHICFGPTLTRNSCPTSTTMTSSYCT